MLKVSSSLRLNNSPSHSLNNPNSITNSLNTNNSSTNSPPSTNSSLNTNSPLSTNNSLPSISNPLSISRTQARCTGNSSISKTLTKTNVTSWRREMTARGGQLSWKLFTATRPYLIMKIGLSLILGDAYLGLVQLELLGDLLFPSHYT